MIEIHNAENEDYAVIRKIAEATWPVTYGAILSKEQIDYMFDMMYTVAVLKEQAEVKKHHFLIAKENGEALGFASYELHYGNQPVTKIHKIYILPTTQGKGIGKLLIDSISNAAIASNDSMLSLNVNRYNSAFTFYIKSGFEKVAEEDIAIGNGYLMEDYVMEKQL